jgi:hypothetical protein
MSKIPYHATELIRATVQRMSRAVLGPVENAPENSYRLVQVITDQELFIGFDDLGDPETHAGGRDYNMVRLPGVIGTVVPFPMLPNQTLYMMAARNMGANKGSIVYASLIVQHWMRM